MKDTNERFEQSHCNHMTMEERARFRPLSEMLQDASYDDLDLIHDLTAKITEGHDREVIQTTIQNIRFDIEKADEQEPD